jgi:hypothetical protein
MSYLPITARRQIRRAAMDALSVLRSTNRVRLLASPGVLPSQSETMPSLLVRVSYTSKETMTASRPDFTSAVTLEMESRLAAATGEAAQDEIEDLDAHIEQALLASPGFVRLTQRITIETSTEITSEARNFVAWTKWSVRCELVEVFDPVFEAPGPLEPVAVPLAEVTISAGGVVGIDIPLPQ